jgi:hypothetical protein
MLGRPVDLIVASSITNSFLKESVNQSKQELYAA